MHFESHLFFNYIIYNHIYVMELRFAESYFALVLVHHLNYVKYVDIFAYALMVTIYNAVIISDSYHNLMKVPGK